MLDRIREVKKSEIHAALRQLRKTILPWKWNMKTLHSMKSFGQMIQVGSFTENALLKRGGSSFQSK